MSGNGKSGNVELADLDLRLYLARAMPVHKRVMLAFALLVNPDLRARLKAARLADAAYREGEMPGLAARLFPESGAREETPRSRIFKVTHDDGSTFSNQANRANPSLWIRWETRLAGSLAVLALCALPLMPRLGGTGSSTEDFTAKGRGLGVNLFVKGDTAYRVENQSARVSQADTLQVVPLGSEPQHLILLGWDARQGLVRIFPREGLYSRRVSHGEPPPALLLQGIADNRLICVTATSPFRVTEVEALLRRTHYQSAGPAPASRLEGGMYLQIFAISKRDGRI